MKNSLRFKSDAGEVVVSGFGQNSHDVGYPPLARWIQYAQPQFLPLEVLAA